MFPYFLLGLVLVVAAYFLLRWFTVAEPRQVRKILLWAAGVVGFLVLIGLVTVGRQLLFALLIPMLLLFLALRPVRARAKAERGPTPGRSSDVRTRLLEMLLDHDSGEMWGRVLEGPFAGRDLGDLSPLDLLSLWRFCLGEDEQSARLLESYLDRRLGEAWREGAEAPAAGEAAMTREEAFEILGLEPGAGEAEIRKAYRSLMQKYHPDQGGSDYLAAKINQAKALLLGD